MRPIQPKDEGNRPTSGPETAHETSKAFKRRCVSSACIPCRKRKSKCDGEQPTCSTCTAVYKTPCCYDFDSDHRRKGALKKEVADLTVEKESLVTILEAIKSGSDAQLAEIVRHIRANESLDVIAHKLGKDETLIDFPEASAEGGLVQQFIGRAAFEEAEGIRAYGHSSSLGLVSDRDTRPTQLHNLDEWTNVTRDKAFVGSLMRLYFSWVHPLYCFFSEKLFLDDMAHNQTANCSSLLVNAILAVASHYSDNALARSDPIDHSTAGDHFFGEAKRILNQDDAASLTTVQALALMGLREVSTGRPNSGFQYAGRCVRMLVELGLHLSVGSDAPNLEPRDVEARKITFWACFSYETTWSIAIGRIAQLPRAAITVQKPTMEEHHNQQYWEPWNDFGPLEVARSAQPTFALSLLRQYSSLSEIVNDTVFVFYAPQERFTSLKLLEFYGRCKRWFEDLPEECQLRDVSSAHVLTLHMYYHTVVVHLFRPFLRVDLANSQVSPQEICVGCANRVASLVATYRQLYGLRRVPVLVSHIILATSIIHLLDLPNASAAQHLAQAVTGLREMTVNHAFSFRCLRIIMALADQWKIELPPVVKRAAKDIPAEALLEFPTQMQEDLPFFSPFPNIAQCNGYINETTTRSGLPLSSQASQFPYSPLASFYWSPFSDGSTPLQGSSPLSPIDTSAVFHPQYDQWQQWSQDGFHVAAPSHQIPSSAAFHNNGHWPQR